MAQSNTTEANAPVPLVFGKGEIHVGAETAVPNGFARRMSNFDIDDTGIPAVRPEFGASVLAGVKDLWSTQDHSATYGFVGTQLVRYVGGYVPVLDTFGNPFFLHGWGRTWFVELNGEVWFSNGVGLWRINQLGLVAPAFEGPIPTRDEGEVVDVRNVYEQMPGGKYLTKFAGRLWLAQGSLILYSEPLAPGLRDPRYGFITAPGEITALGSVSDGLYVSTAREVWFLSDADPDKMQLVKASDAAAVPDSQVYLPFDTLDTNALAVNGSQYQVSNAFAWLTRHGLAVGIPSGVVRILTADFVRLPQYHTAYTTLVARDGFYQVISVVDSVDTLGRGRYVDSPVTTL